ncbi:hypothetical protein [Neptunitalea lumnitzerae]|uniref:Lipocalin-like domain-containing protein n=1 Tax=Neptunitalea lumnitzerae TaxID=2965509 RepID=A0ABQ5MLU5_9FLAO|nr:hypothetical protein [Neptunitalea sp. Y10]GLB50317.1 hypothetical protein Y10_26850 [Neptunitalea sp. Y10]
MKKIISLLLVGFLLVNCSDNDEDSNRVVTPVEGTWQLMEARFYGLEGGSSSEDSIDYSDQNIVYTFNSDGTLEVSGGDNAGYTNGIYTYEYEANAMGVVYTQVVYIDESMWYFYNYEEGEIRLSKLHVDGPELVFVEL